MGKAGGFTVSVLVKKRSEVQFKIEKQEGEGKVMQIGGIV